MTAYQSISVDEESARNPRGPKRNDNRVRLMVIGFLVLALITTSFRALSRQNDDEEKAAGKYSSTTNSRHINVPMPAGVNLGSWVSELSVSFSCTNTQFTHIISSIFVHNHSSYHHIMIIPAFPRRLVLRRRQRRSRGGQPR